MTGIMIGVGNLMEAWGDSGVAEAKKEFPLKADNDKRDYSLLGTKNYLYEVGQGLKNRKSLTLMSSAIVPEAYSYINLSWITGIPETDPREHAHDYDELLSILEVTLFDPMTLAQR
jgi:hypothetical protein